MLDQNEMKYFVYFEDLFSFLDFCNPRAYPCKAQVTFTHLKLHEFNTLPHGHFPTYKSLNEKKKNSFRPEQQLNHVKD